MTNKRSLKNRKNRKKKRKKEDTLLKIHKNDIDILQMARIPIVRFLNLDQDQDKRLKRSQEKLLKEKFMKAK